MLTNVDHNMIVTYDVVLNNECEEHAMTLTVTEDGLKTANSMRSESSGSEARTASVFQGHINQAQRQPQPSEDRNPLMVARDAFVHAYQLKENASTMARALAHNDRSLSLADKREMVQQSNVETEGAWRSFRAELLQLRKNHPEVTDFESIVGRKYTISGEGGSFDSDIQTLRMEHVFDRQTLMVGQDEEFRQDLAQTVSVPENLMTK